MALVLLVRHGQASFGAEDYDVLSETGVEQSRRLGAALAVQGLTPGALVHGAMRRQRDTAAALAEGAGWALRPELDRGWDEFDHVAVVSRGLAADADLTDRRTFQRVFERATARWSDGAHDADYDEPWPAFLGRVREVLGRALDREAVTVAVTSGGPIAAACAQLVDQDAATDVLPRLWSSFNTVLANASVTRVVQGSTGRRLLSFNEHSHLPRTLLTYR
ncbi:MAG TPA: histidine phosphatase family protein [Nocardioides sp.]|jgi:broad specificity phosphatase PhoE|uniref:histidine phosphatase family protein n=1 Tax=Nocardioides sp. TaxID=35761 RepID=UPI002E3277FA|nr:histidine phosphatase family protein [Nocardioides sp.]HEX3930238.1 histidine phosphatase family protein [Nocardioides sp.]